MVQYIPSPQGSYPYPNAGQQENKFQTLGNLGMGLGGLLSGVTNAIKQHQQEAAQKAFMSMNIGDLLKKLQPQQAEGPQNAAGGAIPGPKGYTPPGAGPNAMPAGSTPLQPPPMGRPQMTMRDMALMSHFAPSLAEQASKSLFPGNARQRPAQPTETYFADPKTGRPSLIQKPGMVSVQGKPGEWRKVSQQWALSDMHEDDKKSAIAAAKAARQAKFDNDIMAKTRPLELARQKFNELVEARKKLGDTTRWGSLEEQVSQMGGLAGTVGRQALLPSNVRAFIDARKRNLGDIKGMTGGRVTQWELKTLPEGMFPSLNEPLKNVDIKQKDFNNKIDTEIAMMKHQAKLEHEAIGAADDERLNAMFQAPQIPGLDAADDAEPPTSAEQLLDQEVTP